MKKPIFATIFLLFIALTYPSFAADTSEQNLSYSVNGKTIQFNESMGFPYLTDNGRTMLPLRICLGSIGCSVDWDQSSQMVKSKKGNTEVNIPIGKNSIIVNQKTVAIDNAAALINGRTYLPLRSVLEAYGYQVAWDEKTKTVSAASVSGSEFTPFNINGGTTGIFSRKQLTFSGFDGIQADVTLPMVTLNEKGDCPYVYFGFDWPNDTGNAEGGFQFIEDPTHPGYDKWTVFMRQGNDWRWGDHIVLEQGSTHNLKFYSIKSAENRTDLVIELDGKEVVRKISQVDDFSSASVKAVVAMAMSKPFDGTNCPSVSIGAKISNLKVSTSPSDQYSDFADFTLYGEYRPAGTGGFWYGTAECIPTYLHYGNDGSISIDPTESD